MPKLTLAEKLERSRKIKSRAEQRYAQLKDMERKARTRQLIELGGLVAKAGIDTLPASALYACFLRIAAEAKADPNTVVLWEREGGRHFQAEEDNRVVAVARFADKAEPELTAALRRLGFRWNKLLGQWEGKVLMGEARPVVEENGGVLTEPRPEPAVPLSPHRGPQPG